MKSVRMLFIAVLCLQAVAQAQSKLVVTVREAGPTTDPKTIEIRGLRAGSFDPKIWQAGALHLLPDLRSPILPPREGKFRNIYAPSAVQVEDGWRIFYGGWDGTDTGNDRIYSCFTSNFLSFENRHTVIEHGPFEHVCNVSAVPITFDSYAMLATAFPDAKGLNKPAYFWSPDGKIWNDSPEPHVARQTDIISMTGYPFYSDADINGMNVLLFDGRKYVMYFGNFKDFGNVYRATSSDGHHYSFEKPVLAEKLAVNDVKKFKIGDKSWYLMGLHMNTDHLSYSVSDDPLNFPPTRKLLDHLDQSDKYIVAVGFVCQGTQDLPGRHLLGVLYGAGATSNLSENRIFARWLQKRMVLKAGNKQFEPIRSFGPDRALLNVDQGSEFKGRIQIYAEDGKTPIGRTEERTWEAGQAYAIVFD